MPILNYTTKIDAWQTVNEIQKILVKHKATHFSIKNEGSRPVALAFTIDFKGQPLNFLLPCKSNGVWEVIKKDRYAIKVLKKAQRFEEEQSFRIAWRIVKDWVEAQLALVEVEMVKIEEVFMPYLIINNQGETLANRLLNGGGLKLLTNE